MAKVCLCLTGKTLARDLEVLEKYRRWVDVAELRVDYLAPDERFHIRRFPRLAGIPTILTVRRKADGGRFIEGEGSRIVLLASGLAFADTEKRHNFAYVDIEEDLDVPSLEEAARTFGTRIIRSYHDFKGVPTDLAGKLNALRRNGDEIAKVVVMPRGLADLALIHEASASLPDAEKIVLGMGSLGTPTRILAEKFGSMLSYTTPRGESDLECAGPGQPDPIDLVDIYRFHEQGPSTKIYAIIGKPDFSPATPAIQNPAFTRAGLDAVYVPFPADSLPGFFRMADEIGIDGVSITIPYEQSFVPYLTGRSVETEKIGVCNIAVRSPAGWYGYNTAAASFADSLLSVLGKKNLRWKRIALIGAGCVARAVAAELYRLGARVCILNRTELRAKEIAERYGFAWGGLDGRGVQLLDHFNSIVVQATSVGMEPDIEADPLALYRFSGRETVMDLIYRPEKTQLLKRAEESGCTVISGREMLQRQVSRQFKLFTGIEYPAE
ncbi:MAG: type I 3-dehydroquinate dehydratase [Treponemataceae bacterium]